MKKTPFKRPGMKIPRFKELVHHFQVFSNFTLRVVIADDIEAAAHYVADRDYTEDPTGELGDAVCISSPAGGYANVFLKPDCSIGTIAHESYHAVHALMEFIGAYDEEIIAYHLGFVVDAIVEFKRVTAKFFKSKGRGKKK